MTANLRIYKPRPQNQRWSRGTRQLIIGAEEWESFAACIGKDPDLFFPVSADNNRNGEHWEPGKRICAKCPVRERCLTEAMRSETRTEQRYGLFGGLTPSERTKLARERRP